MRPVTLCYFRWVAQSPPDWQEILTNFRGSELQNYFTRILEDDLQATIKPQYVDHIPKAVRCAAPLATGVPWKALCGLLWRLRFISSQAVPDLLFASQQGCTVV